MQNHSFNPLLKHILLKKQNVVTTNQWSKAACFLWKLVGVCLWVQDQPSRYWSSSLLTLCVLQHLPQWPIPTQTSRLIKPLRLSICTGAGSHSLSWPLSQQKGVYRESMLTDRSPRGVFWKWKWSEESIDMAANSANDHLHFKLVRPLKNV